MDPIKVKVKYHADIPHIEKIDKGEWYDLRAAEDVLMRVGEYRMISLGISMELPEGYEAHVLPRSSTFKNYGIIMTNSEGIIDNSYSGDQDIWHFPAYCLEGKTADGDCTIINKGDRICQFRIRKRQEDIEFVEVDHLDGPNRGGFGSTGVK